MLLMQGCSTPRSKCSIVLANLNNQCSETKVKDLIGKSNKKFVILQLS